jgi:hypothetical protein
VSGGTKIGPELPTQSEPVPEKPLLSLYNLLGLSANQSIFPADPCKKGFKAGPRSIDNNGFNINPLFNAIKPH